MKAHELEILNTAKAVVAHYQNDPTAAEMVAHHRAIIAKYSECQEARTVTIELVYGVGYSSKAYAKKVAEKKGFAVSRIEFENGLWYAYHVATFNKN